MVLFNVPYSWRLVVSENSEVLISSHNHINGFLNFLYNARYVTHPSPERNQHISQFSKKLLSTT